MQQINGADENSFKVTAKLICIAYIKRTLRKGSWFYILDEQPISIFFSLLLNSYCNLNDALLSNSGTEDFAKWYSLTYPK